MSDAVKQIYLNKQVSFQLVQGDITREALDAIVNAANAHLQHGGGVAGVIAKQGGSQIQEESDVWVRQHGPLTHRSPAYTRAGLLPCRYVIHAVGPVWGSGDEDAKLAQAVDGSLRVAEHLELRSLALPAISTGIFGFPVARAARVTISAVQDHFTGVQPTCIELVRIIIFDDITLNHFAKTWEEIFNEQ